MYLTKTDYLAYKQCPKSLWMTKNQHKTTTTSDSMNSRFEKGNLVTEVARELFSGGALVTFQEHTKMINETKILISKNVPIVYEGTFEHDGMLVRCDILVRDDDGWNLYEVKSSTELKERHYDDLAFQAYVLQKSKIPLKSMNVVYLNKQYIRKGEIDIPSLFTMENITDETMAKLTLVDKEIKSMKGIIGQPSYAKDIGSHCEKYGKDDYPCLFTDSCWSHIPDDSVFDIPRFGKKKYDLHHKGILSIADIPDDYPLSPSQKFQVTAFKENRKFIDKTAISDYMTQFYFPLYFLDFETFQQPIPTYEGTKPYQQIPFQYSLHILKDETSPLTHKEFLAKEGEDPRRTLAERLVEDIPLNICSVAYNMGFEKMVLKNLSELFPDLADHLMNIHDHMVDLMIPFQKKWYYINEMKGSYSIKYVLPALFSSYEELNYSNLTIQNGSMAMDIYETLHLKPIEEIEKIREDLLAYCRLDTLAMVRIWEKLKSKVIKY